MDEHIFTVSQLNNLVREVIEMGFPQSVWVCGEIQGYSRNRDKNHIFFELCEKASGSKDTVARIGLVIFSGRKTFIRQVLKNAENAFELKDDIEVKFLCKIDFYPPHGAMRLIVESIDPFYTLGKIAQEKQKLINLLKEKGVLERNKLVQFPEVPLKIGLITAYDSAAYNDFISELSLSGYAFKVYCCNALMQGKGTQADVCKALDVLNKNGGLDVIVITRGGGSVSDLSWFDDRLIVEKIAASSLPVLSGIGHEINITICDLAAHVYQKTPTAIARFLVEKISCFLSEVEEKVNDIIEGARDIILSDKKALKECAFSLQSKTNYFLKSHREGMIKYTQVVKKSPLQFISGLKDNLKQQDRQLTKSCLARLNDESKRMENYVRIIGIANPENTLKRGFSVTRDASGKVLRSIKMTKSGDVIKTQLLDGSLESQIEKKTEERYGRVEV